MCLFSACPLCMTGWEVVLVVGCHLERGKIDKWVSLHEIRPLRTFNFGKRAIKVL